MSAMLTVATAKVARQHRDEPASGDQPGQAEGADACRPPAATVAIQHRRLRVVAHAGHDGRQPVGERVEDEQVHEVDDPQQDWSRPRVRRGTGARRHAAAALFVGDELRGAVDRAASGRAACSQRASWSRLRPLTARNCSDSGRPQIISSAIDERDSAAEDEHRSPAERGDHPQRRRAPASAAPPVKPTVMHIISVTRLRFGLNSPTSAVAFGMMQPMPMPAMNRSQSSCWHVLRKGGGDGHHREEQRGADEHRPPADLVGHHAEDQRADQHAEVGGGEDTGRAATERRPSPGRRPAPT